MKIVVDVTPISAGSSSLHKFRGVGSYTRMLSENLPKFDKKNLYYFLSEHDLFPPDTEMFHIPYFDLFGSPVRSVPHGKRVVTIHDLIPIRFPEHFPAGLKGSIRWALQKVSLSKVDGIMTDSYASKKDILQFTGIDESKIHVVYLAADPIFRKLQTGEWKNQIRSTFHLPDKYILYVGDATWNKNLPRLIEAVTKLKIPIVLAGRVFINPNFDRKNTWNYDLVEVFEKTQDTSLFFKPGFVSQQDLVALYNLASVLVLPSLYEGFGLPLLEAMQSGCPVITSKEGSLPEIAGEAAIYADAFSSQDIAEKIHEILSDKAKAQEFSVRGLEQSKKFSLNSMIQGTVHVYEKVLSGK